MKKNEELIKNHLFRDINRTNCKNLIKKAKLILRETQVDQFYYESLESAVDFKETVYEMTLPEFLLFICRVSQEAFIKEQISFDKKLDKCLEILLKSVG